MKDIVQSYLPLVDFLAETLGPTAEVVLHDFRLKEHSMVAIRNDITGRKAGDATMTEDAQQMVRRAEKRGKPFVTNYFSSPVGKRILRSSTYFIRDEEEHIVGILGVNVDVTELWAARNTVDRLLTLGTEIKLEPDAHRGEPFSGGLPFAAQGLSEDFGDEPDSFDSDAAELVPAETPSNGSPVETMVYAVLDEVLASCGSEPKRLMAREKKELVEELNDRGVFLLKGAVTEVARRLAVSEQTVYRYLKGQ